MNHHSAQPPSYPPSIPSSFQTLAMLFALESDSSPHPTPHRWIYGLCAFTTFALMSFSLFTHSSQIEQASQEVQQAVYSDYLSLIHY